MTIRPIQRAAAVMLVVGALFSIATALIHPTGLSEPYASPAHLEAVAASGTWIGAHIGLFFAVLLVISGLVGLGRSMSGDWSDAWARFGTGAALMSGAAALVVVAVDGIGVKIAAVAWVNAAGPDRAAYLAVAQAVEGVHVGLVSLWMVLYLGAAYLLFGLAVASSAEYPRWLGWVAVPVAIVAALAGLLQAYNGPSVFVSDVLLGACAAVLTLWTLVMGALLWRRAGAAT